MAQLTVRNIPDDLVRALRIRAARHGKSAESEHRTILANVLAHEIVDFWSRADTLRNSTMKQRSESSRLLREMRDKR